MSRFNTVGTTRTTNFAGGEAFNLKPEQELYLSCISTFLTNRFYESGDERIDRIVNLIPKCNYDFVVGLAKYVRKEMHLRSVFHVLVGELSRDKRSKGKSIVRNLIADYAERPDDLTEIVAYLGEPIPNQVKKGIAQALNGFSPYQLAKYRADNKRVSLVDLLNLTHPKPIDDKHNEAFKKIVNGNLKNTETWESKASKSGDVVQALSNLLMENKLGYMALLRNLRNLEKANDKAIEKACSVIADPERVRKSKQLPFRFYKAYQHIDDQRMVKAVSEALEISLDNVPKLDGNTLVAVDMSGSMTYQGTIDIASIFASVLLKANGAELVMFDYEIRSHRYVQTDSALGIAQSIIDNANGGGTDTDLVFQHITNTGEKYQNVIILSDNESWVGNANNAYKEAQDKVGKLYCIDLEGYGSVDIKGANVYHIGGWSERMFDFINETSSLTDIVNKVKSYK
jgi:hypothetical protein